MMDIYGDLKPLLFSKGFGHKDHYADTTSLHIECYRDPEMAELIIPLYDIQDVIGENYFIRSVGIMDGENYFKLLIQEYA